MEEQDIPEAVQPPPRAPKREKISVPQERTPFGQVIMTLARAPPARAPPARAPPARAPPARARQSLSEPIPEFEIGQPFILAISDFLRTLLYFSNSIFSNREGFSTIIIRIEKIEQIINEQITEYVAKEIYNIGSPLSLSTREYTAYYNLISKAEKVLGNFQLSDSAKYFVSEITPFLRQRFEMKTIVPKNIAMITVVSAVIYCLVCILEYSDLVSEVLDKDIGNCAMIILPEKYANESFKLAESSDVLVGNSFERLLDCGINLNENQKELFKKVCEYIFEISEVSDEARKRVCLFASHPQL